MMTRLAFTLLLTWVSLCRSALAWEADKDVRLQRELSERHFNGVVLVAKGERIVFKEAFGFRNFDAKEPSDVGTAYEVGSVSKPFTATAILLLEERGDLSLSDPLTKYFPKLPYAEVTLERMLVRTPVRLSSGDAGPYGLGFRIQEGPDGRTIVVHTGSTNGFPATCTFPTEENDTTVILVTNIAGDGFAELRTAVFDIVWSDS